MFSGVNGLPTEAPFGRENTLLLCLLDLLHYWQYNTLVFIVKRKPPTEVRGRRKAMN
jgi:hypothetical protein